MKKLLCVLLCLILASASVAAVADPVTIDPYENRGITPADVGVNPRIDGVSPTTGRVLADIEVPDGFAGLAATGRYFPLLVQISNSGGGINKVAPWNVIYADVFYETPLYREGTTRISCLFSDLMPTIAGPIRSARVGHIRIREEWDCAFVHWGGQEYEETNYRALLRELGVFDKNLDFDGIAPNRAGGKLFERDERIAVPNNVQAFLSQMASVPAEDQTAAEHAWLFADEPLTDGDDALSIRVTWGEAEGGAYNSLLEYDEDEDCYYRYLLSDPKNPELYKERKTGTPITFTNVIIQDTDCNYVAFDAPDMQNVGEGNADFFMNGRHIAGYWKRADMESRTVFYGPDGNEISLRPGRTLIVMIDEKNELRSVSYE